MRPTLDQAVVDDFGTTFGASPEVLARAPSRVELLGNHTDYHDGLVLAAAIDRYTVVAGRSVGGREARVRSVRFGDADAFDVGAIEPGEPGSWRRYVRGVTWALGEAGGISGGFEAAITGDVPLGAGLSSSASLQAALAIFLIEAGRAEGWAGDLDDPARMALAKILRRSENEFVGVASGLLDQFSVLFGRADHALTLDCRSLEAGRVPLGDPAPAIVVCDSKTSRRLADGMYNRRREEGERVVKSFREHKDGEEFENLRDITLDELMEAWDTLDPVGRRRARHVLMENERVRVGADLLKKGDVAGFGALMSASHASSRDDFENSAPALDALIESAEEAPGFLGGKLSGAGWAGCTVNLVVAEKAGAFAEAVAEGYARRTGVIPEVHVCRATDGASAGRVQGA